MTAQNPARPFLSDIEEFRRLARQDMEKGALTGAYGLDVTQVVDVLNRVLASEIVCVLRYKSHYYAAKGIHAEPVAAEFLQHANEEQVHADRVAVRITELNGAPNLNPEGMLSRSVAQYGPGGSLVDMIKEDLIAERVVIMWYMDLVKWFGDNDPTSRRMMEDLLAQEETHARDLADMLSELDTSALEDSRTGASMQGSKGSEGRSGTRPEGTALGVSDGLDGR